MKKGSITRSSGFQVLLYLLLAAGALCGCFCMLIGVWLWNWGAERVPFSEFERRILTSEAYEHLDYICEDEYSFPTIKDMIDAFEAESAENNVKYAIYRGDSDELVWTNTSSFNIQRLYGYEAYFGRLESNEAVSVIIQDNGAKSVEVIEFELQQEFDQERNPEEEYIEYRAVLYVDAAWSHDDDLKDLHEMASFWYHEKDLIYMGAVGGLLLCLLCLVWILCNAGHRWRKEGISPGVLTNIYLDILTVFFGAGAVGLLAVGVFVLEDWSDLLLVAVVVAVIGAVLSVWCTIYLRELALRFKLGKWWQHTLLYAVCRLLGKALRFIWKASIKVIVHIPEIHFVIIGIAFLTLCEYVGIMAFVRWNRDEVLTFWMLEKVVVIPVILYCALAFAKLRRGSRALAQGDLSRKLDTKYMLLHFKEHGEDLNRIGTGISKAVEERLQSERLKTELITNVSHDLKTPLTSVINYADLLAVAAKGEDENRDAQIIEYSEVLLRQAGRLKKLLEDLVEASKAATGNLELQLVPCELGVLLTQAGGEYEERFAQKELKLILKKPEEEIYILADGRQLWRVFENLMNNICKYAQEGSRVYLNMEKNEQYVEIIFRNISKYELEIAPEELTERFVRGDASRHMEGSGLGLSIAQSLVDLQNGTMQIMTDGDLFKVILRFKVCEEKDM